jgi:acetyl-CoA carboxylase carboxyltransferase component
MPVRSFESAIDVHSELFASNVRSMEPLVAQLSERLQASRSDGSRAAQQRHRARGKLMPRERIAVLLDDDSPWLELCPLAGVGQDAYAVGGNSIHGVGLVCGVACHIVANKFTVKGGTADEPTLMRGARASAVAVENRLPTIMLVETGGANLTEQFKVFHAGGGSFYGMTRASRAHLPQLSVVFGSSTAGGAYTPGMSDYVIMVKQRAQVFLGGPPLVKMATGEVTDAESLGGAEMHSAVSGVSDYLAEDELDALRLCRELVASLARTLPPRAQPLPDAYARAPPRSLAPLCDPRELLGVCGADIRRPYDAREVIARIVDRSAFNEFKQRFGTTVVCAFAQIHGIDVGVIANNGVLLSESSLKAAQFIQLCNQKHTPLLFLHNITGFMVGRAYEEGGIIKDGSKLINAVSNSDVPAISVIMGASFGAGNYAMCFPEHDHEILTSAGFLSLADVERRVAVARDGSVDSWRGLTVASYDAAAQTLVYREPSAVVVNRAGASLVDFRGDKGRFSFAATRQHLVYAATAADGDFEKVPAADLLDGDARGTARFLAAAAGGVAGACVSGRSVAALEAHGALLFDTRDRFEPWLWSLPTDEARAVVRGVCAAAQAGDAQRIALTGDSLALRDDLLRLLLHAGYAAAFQDGAVQFGDSAEWREPRVELANATVSPTLYDGRTWCFDMNSGTQDEWGNRANDGFVVVRRVRRDASGAVCEAFQPTIQGNCGRAYHPRFLYSWPQARVSVMGADQLSGVLDIVARQAAARDGQQVDEEAAAARLAMFKAQVEEQSDAYYVSSRCIDDGIIDPRDTRDVVGMSLALCFNTKVEGTLTWGVHRL